MASLSSKGVSIYRIVNVDMQLSKTNKTVITNRSELWGMSVTMDEPILYTSIINYGRLHGLLLNQVVMAHIDKCSSPN